MSEQSRPTAPDDGQGTADAEGRSAEKRGGDVPAAEQTGRTRAAYLDPRGSEATRELRDTARRRRDAEEKLQQHLMEAKEHVPNEFHAHHKAAHEGERRPQAGGHEGETGHEDETRHDGGARAEGPDGHSPESAGTS
ncbi:hypothetical protein [Arthrobacter sp. MAHUQ-56]